MTDHGPAFNAAVHVGAQELERRQELRGLLVVALALIDHFGAIHADDPIVDMLRNALEPS